MQSIYLSFFSFCKSGSIITQILNKKHIFSRKNFLMNFGPLMQLFVWNQHSTQPVLKYCEHTAAMKAIAWSPHLYGLLASGGGTADRCIRFWNTTTNSHLNCVDTGSQVIKCSALMKHMFSKD